MIKKKNNMQKNTPTIMGGAVNHMIIYGDWQCTKMAFQKQAQQGIDHFIKFYGQLYS